jgi:hypothetical protein
MGSSNSISDSSSSSSNSLSNSFSELVGGVVGIAYYLLKNRMDVGWEDTIREKLRKEMDKNPNLERQIEEKFKVSLNEFAVALGDEELFKKTFLLPYYHPKKILEEVEKELEQVKMLNDTGCPMTEAELKETIQRINNRKSKLSEHKFELILTECQASKINNILFKSFVNSYYEFGALHSALSLDGTIIEWGRGPCGDSLVCPTMVISQFLFAFEVKAKEDEGFFTMIGNIIKDAITSVLDFFSGGAFGRWSVGRANEKKLDQIAKICVMFNRCRYYNPVNLNCQHFVKTILKAIDSDFSSDGEFRNIIDRLEQEGKVDFIFGGRNFTTRKQLDDYVKSIDFNNLCKNDKKLLLSYKNTFDKYLINDKNNEKYKTTDEARKY